MIPIRRILLAIKDPGTSVDPGVAKTAALARACGASLELFHSIGTPLWLPTEADPMALANLKRDAIELQKRRLETLAAPARRRGVAVSCSVVWDSPPHDAIVRHAAETGADLIVAMCHRGRRGSWLLRLTDFELLRASKLPVLLLKNAEVYRRPVVLAAVDPDRAHDKPPTLDSRILTEARRYAATLRGPLHAIHVTDSRMPALAARDLFASPYALPRAFEELQHRQRVSFDELVGSSNIPTTRRHLVDGDPVKAIPRYARELGAGLVVMGAVSRSGLKGLFIGNTAEQVLADLPCDILVVKPRRFENHVPAGHSDAVVLSSSVTVDTPFAESRGIQ